MPSATSNAARAASVKAAAEWVPAVVWEEAGEWAVVVWEEAAAGVEVEAVWEEDADNIGG